MRIMWDAEKSLLIKNNPERLTSFEEAQVLISNLERQMGGDLKSDDPEQYYTIGFASNGKLVTLVFEYREDHLGEYVHLVTLWKTTKAEKERFGI